MIHLLSCGLSVVKTWEPSLAADGDTVVGVSWAALRYPCDWACLKDSSVYGEFCIYPDLMPRVGFVSDGHIAKAEGKEYRNFTGSKWWLRHSMTPCQLTFPDALLWCLESGASADEAVKCYGVDMTGGDGICPNNWNHGPERWARESEYIRLLEGVFPNRVEWVKP